MDVVICTIILYTMWLRWLYSKMARRDIDENVSIKEETTEDFVNVFDLFERYNTKYFGGVLCGVRVGWGENMRENVGACVCDKDGCEILLNGEVLQYRDGNDIKSILIHEMIHAYLFLIGVDEDDHGESFMREAERIGKLEGCKITTYHSFHEEVAYLYSL